MGHIFSARRVSDNELVDFMIVDGSNYYLNPSNRLETCELREGSEEGSQDAQFAPADQLSCGNMVARFHEFSQSVWHLQRIGLNYVQPQLVPPVTKEGFLHIKLPTDTYKWLKDWYVRMYVCMYVRI